MAIPCDCCATETTRCVVPNAPSFNATFLSQAPFRTVGPGPGGFTFTNFAGSGVNVIVTPTGDSLGASGGALGGLVVPSSSQRTVQITVGFSQPVFLRKFGFEDLDFGGNSEFAYNFAPKFIGVYGQKQQFTAVQPAASPATTSANNPAVRGTIANDIGGVLFAGPLSSTLDFSVFHASGAGSFLTELAFDLANTHTAITLFHCPEGNIWYDLDGNVINPANFSDCV